MRGHAGPLSLEVFNDVFRQADPGSNGRSMPGVLSLLLEEVDGANSITRRLPAPSNPARVRVRGTRGRAEFRLGRRNASSTRWGSRLTAQHRTKPVTLFGESA